MICDCHVNIWEDRHVLPAYREQLNRVRPGAMPEKADADTLYSVLQGVDKAIIFTLRYGDTMGVEGDDETTAQAVKKYADKFVGFAYVDPRRKGYVDELKRAVEEMGLKGVKYGPIYNGVALDDPLMVPIYEYCIENDLPLTMHMGTTYAHHTPIEMGHPSHVDAVAERYPELKMVLAHMGHPWYADCIAVVRKRENVYCEISALFYRPWQFYNILITAQEYLTVDKIFFGTDFPFSTPEESLKGLRAVNRVVEGSSLPRVSDQTIESIIHSNPFEFWWHGPGPV